MDKSVIYVDVVYLKYFTDLSAIHKYNYGAPVFSTYTRSWVRLVILEDKVDDGVLHAAYSNLLLLIFS